jgi:hypothetical protein
VVVRNRTAGVQADCFAEQDFGGPTIDVEQLAPVAITDRKSSVVLAKLLRDLNMVCRLGGPAGRSVAFVPAHRAAGSRRAADRKLFAIPTQLRGACSVCEGRSEDTMHFTGFRVGGERPSQLGFGGTEIVASEQPHCLMATVRGASRTAAAYSASALVTRLRLASDRPSDG